MSEVVLGLRLGLAVVFAVAAAGKFADRSGSATALGDFGLPGQLLGVGAVALPALELLIALALLFTNSARVAAGAGLVLLAAFVAAIGRAMARGEAPDCHCFGQIHSEPAGWSTLARNAALAAVAIAILAGGPGSSLTGLPGKDLALVLTSLASVALLGVSLVLWNENRELRSAPAARAGGRPPVARGLPPGTIAPDLALSTLDGEEVRLHELIAHGRPVALVNLSPQCGPCRALLPELSRWQRALVQDLDVLVISSGQITDNLAFAEEHGLSRLYLAQGQRFGELYEVRATPAAVLVDPEGLVEAAPATGAVAIETLIRIGLDRQRTMAS